MKKEFDRWNQKKKEINNLKPNFYRERDVRWCSLGVNVGFEQDGTSESYRRPVVILKGFSRSVCLVVPLTTSNKINPYHLQLGKIEGKESVAILSQIRLIDTKRLHDRLAVLEESKFEELRKAIKNIL